MVVDEPTQKFKPVRDRKPVRPQPKKPAYDDEDDYDDFDDEEEEEEYRPVRKKYASKPVRRDPRREDFDDEDDYDEDDYEDDYDDEDYDDEHVSFGRRLVGLVKAVLAVVVVLALVALALRLLESSKIISLDGLRNTVGKIIPIAAILPDPDGDSGTVPAPMSPVETPDVQATEAPDEEWTGDEGWDEGDETGQGLD